MTTRIMAAALVAGWVALPAGGRAQEKPAAPVTSRTVYTVRHGDAAALAAILAAHFKDEVKVSALPVGAGNGLVISGPQAATADVLKILEQVDRPARAVAVEVTLVEVTVKKGEDGKDPAEPEFAGTPAEVGAKLDALAKAGQVGSLQRVRLNAVEGQPVATTTGGSKPLTAAAAIGPGGGRPPGLAQRSISYHQVGTSVRATARVGADNAVDLDLTVNDSRAKPADAGDETGAPALDNGTLATRVTVPAGRAVTALAVRTDGKAGKTIAYVIVTAKVVETGGVARQ